MVSAAHKAQPTRLFFALLAGVFLVVFLLMLTIWPRGHGVKEEDRLPYQDAANASSSVPMHFPGRQRQRQRAGVDHHLRLQANPPPPTSPLEERERFALEHFYKSDFTLNEARKKRWRTTVFFEHKVQELSRLFLQANAYLNVVFVGACDGTHDKTIETLIRSPHWRAILVEPISFNFVDLQKFLLHNDVSHRAVAVRAAVSNKCPWPRINITLTDWHIRDPKQEHWVVRQTATLSEKVVEGMKRDVAEKRAYYKLLKEEVPCLVGGDVLNEWAKFIDKNSSTQNAETTPNIRAFRPFVLKVDSEGWDYEIVYSFLQKVSISSPQSLPVLIQFESKLIEAFNKRKLQRLLQDVGYETNILEEPRSIWGDDSVAILRPEAVLSF